MYGIKFTCYIGLQKQIIVIIAKPAHNRIVYASPLKRLGLHKTPVGLMPFVVFCVATFLWLLKLLRSFFIATPKTSYTTFTLGEIKIEILENNKKRIDRIIKSKYNKLRGMILKLQHITYGMIILIYGQNN
jgi:hypothetical protein